MLDTVVKNAWNEAQDVINHISLAIPGHDKTLHAIIGAGLAGLGTYVGRKIKPRVGSMRISPYVIGFATVLVAEFVWERFIDPHTKFRAYAPGETMRDYAATLIGYAIYTFGDYTVNAVRTGKITLKNL